MQTLYTEVTWEDLRRLARVAVTSTGISGYLQIKIEFKDPI